MGWKSDSGAITVPSSRPLSTRRSTPVIRIGHPGRRLTAAASVLVIMALLAVDPVSALEVDVFRAINDLPHSVEPMLWVLQQMGSAIVLPFAALLIWRIARHWRPPVAMLAGGFFLGWLAAKGVKALVDRGRPGAMIPDVDLGFDVPVHGFGFPSGHAVLAFTLATVFAPYLSRRWRWAAYGAAVLVGLTRIYVGAHWPLDVVGGAAYGIIVGSIVNLVAHRRRTPSKV